MALAYRTPGVYYERVDAQAGAIATVRMDVPGFVGLAERGPVDTPVLIQSYRQFEGRFGGFSHRAYLAYTVRAFFENGGRRCWVVRVASNDPAGGARAASLTLQRPGGAALFTVHASSPGAWGNGLRLRLTPNVTAQTTAFAGEHRAVSNVASVSGFERADLIRLTQGSREQWRILSRVDAHRNHLRWVSEADESALPYEQPLSGFDPGQPVTIEKILYSLVVYHAGHVTASCRDLSLIPEHPAYAPLRLTPSNATDGAGVTDTPEPLAIREARGAAFDLQYDVQTRRRLLAAQPLEQWMPVADPVCGAPLRPNESLVATLSGGQDGLAMLQPEDFTGDETAARGFRALDAVEEVSAIAVPDLHIHPKPMAIRRPPRLCNPNPCLPTDYTAPAAPYVQDPQEVPPLFDAGQVYRVQGDLVDHCERRADRVAVLDPPLAIADHAKDGVAGVRAWRQRFDSSYAALYFPWLKVSDPLGGPEPIRSIPPCGHILGCWARTDFETGVHKAPANAVLHWSQDVTAVVDDALHGLLNPQGINALRSFPGRGLRLFGARTLSSDTGLRYVNVRRLLILVEKALKQSLQWAVFEGNDVITREKIRLVASSFLISLWQRGALAGETAREAFFVRCDEANNPAPERDIGRLWIEIGIAPTQPFEFVVLRLGRVGNSFQAGGYSAMGGGE